MGKHDIRIQELKRLLDERRRARALITLRNRLARYQKRLLKEGFAVAAASGARIELVGDDCTQVLSVADDCGDDAEGGAAIHVDVFEDENACADEIIDLARDRFPSLHRKYFSYCEKYFSLLSGGPV